MTESWSVWLPLPPSTNALYGTRRDGRKYLNGSARIWREEAGWLLATAHPPKGLVKPVLSLHFGFKGKGRVDVDNRCKAVIDLLVKHGVIADDNDRILPSFVPTSSRSFEGVRITVTPALAVAA